MGQHFLRDLSVAARIVDALPSSPARVIEIGPGRGALTAPLVRRYPRVRALELDASLAADLPRRLGFPAGLDVVEDDAASVDLDSLSDTESWLLAANLPYSSGTAILRRVLRRHDLFPCAVVMLQLEVVERMLAEPGSSERGLLSLEVEAFARATRLFSVAPGAFAPPPKVWSAVVLLRLRPTPTEASALERALSLAAAAFTHRRKKVANSLATALDDPSGVLRRAGIAGGVRPQELPLEAWLSLAEASASESAS